MPHSCKPYTHISNYFIHTTVENIVNLKATYKLCKNYKLITKSATYKEHYLKEECNSYKELIKRRKN